MVADRITIKGLNRDLHAAITDGQLARDARHRTWASTAASALCLALVVFLLYSLLNAGTKGYFAWPLRIVCTCALALFYLGAMYWKGWSRVEAFRDFLMLVFPDPNPERNPKMLRLSNRHKCRSLLLGNVDGDGDGKNID